MPKQVATTNYAIEGDFISADEWSEDKFNKAESVPTQEELAMGFRASQMQGEGALRNAAFNQGMGAQQQGFNQGYSDGVIGSALGGGIFGWRK